MSDAVIESMKQSLHDRVLSEQLALTCRLTTAPLSGSVIVGAMLAWLVSEDHGYTAASIWYVALLLTVLARWRAARAYLSRPREPAEVRRWRAVMVTLAASGGAVWSVAGSFLLPTDPQKEIIVATLLLGATASGLGPQAPVRHGYTALVIPFVLPYAVTQFVMGGERVILGCAFLLYIAVMIVIANRQTDSVERQIRLAIENEALVNELRRERDRANLANHELQAHIEQQNLSTQRIRGLNRDLELQAAELRAANKDLEGFSYSVSHDLRSPLRAIDGFAQLLADEQSGESTQQARHYLGRIRENVSRMAMLIDDLLAFSRCSRQILELETLDMQALARTAANEACSTHVTETAPVVTVEAMPTARGDQRLLLQVWINLLDNAVKYSSKVAQPRVTVQGREEDQRLVYEVIDNGIGFDSRYSSSLFGVFQRLHASREYPGTGVGLAIVQRIVTRHGGEVWARSELNHGATFGFSLPRAHPGVEHQHSAQGSAAAV